MSKARDNSVWYLDVGEKIVAAGETTYIVASPANSTPTPPSTFHAPGTIPGDPFMACEEPEHGCDWVIQSRRLQLGVASSSLRWRVSLLAFGREQCFRQVQIAANARHIQHNGHASKTHMLRRDPDSAPASAGGALVGVPDRGRMCKWPQEVLVEFSACHGLVLKGSSSSGNREEVCRTTNSVRRLRKPRSCSG